MTPFVWGLQFATLSPDCIQNVSGLQESKDQVLEGWEPVPPGAY